ncbi:hypothetical protein [Alloactinosynnema sp. L-07]|uniref:hypothetical protein n=1 Tax=Alloactinosynnema sp. L-07 TaxID=1653480 RepID=UPI00065EFC69|nr:hypothetical protein [Alloactinosynnema sp. L-07]CRK57762.1 hypothetical protein [Alloactinosynnema sp. L-07]
MHINWALLTEVLIAALVTAVGTVVLFALGVRGWSNHADAVRGRGSSVLGIVTALVSFTLCTAVVAFGLWIIVAR